MAGARRLVALAPALLLGAALASAQEIRIVRPVKTDEALAKPHTRLFEMRGRSMTGWVIVDVGAVRTKRQLGPWVRRGVAFASSLPPKGS